MAFDASDLFWSVGAPLIFPSQSAKFYGILRATLSAGGGLASYNLQLKNNLFLFEYSEFWCV